MDASFPTEGIPSILTQVFFHTVQILHFRVLFHSNEFDNNEHAPKARRLSIQALLFF